MALSNLTQLTEAQYNALTITPFPVPPRVSSSGTPDNRIAFQLDGWVGTDVLAFRVIERQNADSGLSIDTPNPNTIDAIITSGSNPNSQTTYWTVNMGPGASGSDWQITYDVADGKVDTGKWVFTKGHAVDVKYSRP